MGHIAWRYRVGGLMAGMLVLPCLAAPLPAEEFDRGQALYQNHCTACHDASVHTRDSRRVQDRDDLQMYVSTWSFHAQLDWSREEINDVTGYVDRTWYRFTEQP